MNNIKISAATPNHLSVFSEETAMRAIPNSHNQQLIGFVICGGVAALVNFVSRIVFNYWLGYSTSIVIGFLFGLVTGFLMNRIYVFKKPSTEIHHQVFWFIMVNLLGLVQTLAISLLFARLVFPWIHMHWHAEAAAHGIGIAVPVATSYIGHKYLTFR